MGAPLTVGWIETTPVWLNKKKKNPTIKKEDYKNSFLSGILDTTGHASASTLAPGADRANPSSAFCSKMRQRVQALTKEAITKASQSLDLNQLV